MKHLPKIQGFSSSPIEGFFLSERIYRFRDLFICKSFGLKHQSAHDKYMFVEKMYLFSSGEIRESQILLNLV